MANEYSYVIKDRVEVTFNEGEYAGTRYLYHPGISIDPESFQVSFLYDFLDNPKEIAETDDKWIFTIGDILMDIISSEDTLELEYKER